MSPSVISGEITGKQEAARNGAPFVSFYGVPFAKPPVGHLRFEAPTPAAAWEGNRDAQKYREVQLDLTPKMEVFHMLVEGCHNKI